MRRINITNGNTRITKSFYDKDEFRKFIVNDLGLLDFDSVAIAVWDLKVAEVYTYCNHKFSIQSKTRAGNVLMNGK